jgi:eukaryotic-like serine/threonine-protein kinase
MEYVDGQTLAERIKSHPPGAAEILDVSVQVADALDEAHSKGITHRDIKPANIMITHRGKVKVLDFGLAKVAASGGAFTVGDITTQANTDPGLLMGTVQYMSPEQALGKEVDHRHRYFFARRSPVRDGHGEAAFPRLVGQRYDRQDNSCSAGSHRAVQLRHSCRA